ncbi:MAG: hypothetical protein OXI91_13770 [Chloroflexota bacterium]|nr:hypothetical protein [Chloroflexota bacterium]
MMGSLEGYDHKAMLEFLRDIERQTNRAAGMELPFIEGITYEEAKELLETAQALEYIWFDSSEPDLVGEITSKGKYRIRALEEETRQEDINSL